MLKKNRIVSGILIECGFVFVLMSLLLLIEVIIMR